MDLQERIRRLDLRLSKARTTLRVSVDPLIGFVSMALPTFIHLDEELEADPNDTQPYDPQRNLTAYTDYKSYVYGFKFCESLNDNMLNMLVAHEAAHVALSHKYRGDKFRDPDTWNRALDYALHGVLANIMKVNIEASAKLQFIPNTYYDTKYIGWTAESIYDDLLQKQQHDANEHSGDSSATPASSNVLDPITHQTSDKETSNIDALRAIETALQQFDKLSKNRQPAQHTLDLLREIRESIEPRIDWRHVFRELTSRKARARYDYSRPSRRSMTLIATGFNIFMPAYKGIDYGRVVVAVDTSGSITDELDSFSSEVGGLISRADKIELHHWSCDTDVYKHRVYHARDNYEPVARGGGGTDFRPIFKEISEMRAIDHLIMFSDTYGAFPDDPPPYPVTCFIPAGCNAQAPSWVRIIPMHTT